jgi:hypothetical protein
MIGATTPAAALAGAMCIGVTLRMVVENRLKYGQMIKDQLEAVNATGAARYFAAGSSNS